MPPEVDAQLAEGRIRNSFSKAALEPFLTGFRVPRAIAVIAEEEFLITGRTGGLYYDSTDAIMETEGLPTMRKVSDEFGVSYGGLIDASVHRNSSQIKWYLGANERPYYDKTNERLYANEHGPLSGDELNLIAKDGNYGWPLFSSGLHYDDTPVTDSLEEGAAVNTILPLKFW